MFYFSVNDNCLMIRLILIYLQKDNDEIDTNDII